MSIRFAGDSITEEWDLSSISGAINCGVGGDTPDGLAARFQADMLDHFPWCAHVLIGTNDYATAGVETVRDMALLARAKGIKVIVSKIPPLSGTQVDAFNAAMGTMAGEERLPLADHFTPLTASGAQNQYLFHGIAPYVNRPFPPAGLGNPHPNKAGHAVMTDTAKQVIRGLRAKAAHIPRETLWLNQ